MLRVINQHGMKVQSARHLDKTTICVSVTSEPLKTVVISYFISFFQSMKTAI